MTPFLQVTIIDDWTELLGWQEAWHDLWLRSAVTSPLVLLAHAWLYQQTFANERPMRAVLVHDAPGRLFAGVVVVGDDGRTGMTVYGLPNNDWADTGALLLDDSFSDQELLLGLVVDGLKNTGAAIVDLTGVRADQCEIPDPKQMPQVSGGRSPVRRLFQTGVIPVDDEVAIVERRWSKNLRKNLRRRQRALGEIGALEFAAIIPHDRQSALASFQRGLDLENLGWKGRQGTAVAQDPAIMAYYRAQVDQLHCDGHLQLFELRLDDRLIAFEYGWITKGVYHSNKTTYDERFGRYSPGQLLFAEVLRYCADHERLGMVDLQGQINESAAAMRPDTVDVVNCSLYLSPTARLTYGLLDRMRETIRS